MRINNLSGRIWFFLTAAANQESDTHQSPVCQHLNQETKKKVSSLSKQASASAARTQTNTTLFIDDDQ